MRPNEEWNAFYQRGEMPWDLQGPSPVLKTVLDLGLLADRPRMLVPGCGRGHDVLQLAGRGHDVWGVDFAEDAIAALNASAAERGLTVTARQANIFDLFDEPAGSFDGMWEYTCFCAIPRADRPRYAELASHLVRPGGRLVFAVYPIFRDQGPDEGPPFMVTPDDVREHFGANWTVLLESAPTVSPAKRRDRERLMVLERK